MSDTKSLSDTTRNPRRRLIEALRMVPIVGLLLFFLPLLWATGTANAASTAKGGLYLFAIWALLIVAAALLGRLIVGMSRPGKKAGTEIERKTDDG